MIKIDAKNVDFYYGDFHALKNISMESLLSSACSTA